MAEVIIKANNIFSKPKYALVKNNIIKNPSIQYSKLKVDKPTYENVFFIINYDGIGTQIEAPVMEEHFGKEVFINNFESESTIPYRIMTFKYQDDYQYNIYNFIILKYTLYQENANNFVFVEDDLEITGVIEYNSYIYDTQLGVSQSSQKINLNAVYVDFDVDNLDINIDNYNDYYSYNSSNKTMEFAYTYIKNEEKLEIYLVLLPYETMQSGTAIVDNEFSKISLSIKNLSTYSNEKVEIKNKNEKVDYTLESSELVDYSNSLELLNKVTNEYKNGRRSVELNVFVDNYYDVEGNLVYDKSLGQTIKVLDEVKIQEYRNGKIVYVGGENQKYKVTSREIEYNGQPIVNLKLLEIIT